MTGAAFMNAVRWKIIEDLKAETDLPVITTYGSMTKTLRKLFCIDKSHANDAFVMGSFHPKHRQGQAVYEKQRRNDRILSKFYDAEYKDIRDGKVKKGQELSCGRTKRKEPRHSKKDLRPFRGHKVKKGRVSVRAQRTQLKPGSIVLYEGERLIVHGTHTRKDRKTGKANTNVEFETPAKNGRKSADMKKVKVMRQEYINAWKHIS